MKIMISEGKVQWDAKATIADENVAVLRNSFENSINVNLRQSLHDWYPNVRNFSCCLWLGMLRRAPSCSPPEKRGQIGQTSVLGPFTVFLKCGLYGSVSHSVNGPSSANKFTTCRSSAAAR